MEEIIYLELTGLLCPKQDNNKKNKVMTENENKTNLSTGWKDGKIVPSVMYQVYGMDAFYGPYEDEKNAYTFTPGVKSTTYSFTTLSDYTGSYNRTVATLPTISDNTKPLGGYTEGEIVRVGNENYNWSAKREAKPEGVADEDIHEVASLPTEGIIKDAWYHVTTGDNAGYYQYADSTPHTYHQYTVTREYNDASTIVIEKGGKTYTGELVSSDTITATITPSKELKTLHSQALVSIDGKEYTLGVLANSITLHMNRDHRISINWIHNELVETFLIVAKR